MNRCSIGVARALARSSKNKSVSFSRVSARSQSTCQGMGLGSNLPKTRCTSRPGAFPGNVSKSVHRSRTAVLVGRQFSLVAADIVLAMANGDLILGSNDDDEGT
mmetsp:Transcript_6397/g.8101  ORF Transcript_6397/g.8101 Transcript_6397/m.8101 type:complete len:104 (-) Transcript_6397:582-893(-)